MGNSKLVSKFQASVVGWGCVRSPDGVFQLVGNSEQTREDCGKQRATMVCLNVEGHGLMCKDGKSHAGEVYFRKYRFSCDKPSCPVCFTQWAVREATSAEFRLLEASKLFGKPEHLMASVPPKDYDKPYKWMHDMAIKVFKARGVLGGTLVYHPFRWDDVECIWYFAPHFHSVGFLEGGYRCRGCKKLCRSGCKGFEATTRRLYENNGWIVKVLDPYRERVSVFKTIEYELKHAGLRVGVRFHRVLTWFGVVSYRKLKLSDEALKKWKDAHRSKCPLCGSNLVAGFYDGSENFDEFGDEGTSKYVVDGSSVWFACGKIIDGG